MTKHESDLSLKELFEFASEKAREIFLATGQVSPLWHALAADGSHGLILTPWNSDEEKDEALRLIREVFQDKQVKRFAFVCEAWSIQVKDKRLPRTRPSKHPDRREIVRISAEDRDGSMLSGHYFILRPEHGKPTLSPFHQDPPDMLQVGRMTGVLM